MRPARHRRLPLAGLLLGLAGCGGGSAAPSQAAGAAPAAPEPETWLVCDEPLVDFGEVVEGATLDHEFVFENRGPQELRVATTRASCGCTVTTLEHIDPDAGARRPYLEGEPVPPGAQLALRTTYHTRGKSGNAPRAVQIFCDQPSGVTSVTIEATIIPWLSVEPDELTVVPLREDQSHTFVHTVKSTGGETFLLEPTGQGIPPQLAVAARALQPDADGRSPAWEVTTMLSPGLPRGVYSYPIHLRTDVLHPDAPVLPDGSQLVIETSPFVTVKIVGKFGVEPPALSFLGVAEKETIASSVRITSYDPDFQFGPPSLRLEPAKAGAPCPLAKTAALSARPVEGQNAWDVQVLLQGLAPEVEFWFTARLVIVTGHPGEPEVAVNVSGRRSDTPR